MLYEKFNNIALKEEKSILNLFKENLSVILISIYLISFTNFFIYYKSFDIPIFSYININDFLFYTLEYIFLVFSTIFISNTILFIIYTILFSWYEKGTYLRKGKYCYYRKNKRIESFFHKIFDKNYPNFVITILLFGIFAVVFSPFKSITLPSYLIYFMYILNKYDKDKKMYNFLITITYFIIFVGIFISNIFNSFDKKIKKDNTDYTILSENIVYRTHKNTSCINYLGETSTNIFLYNIEEKKTIILFKDKVEYISINNDKNLIYRLIEFFHNKYIIIFYDIYLKN